MDKVLISKTEVDEIGDVPLTPESPAPKIAPVLTAWAKLALSPLTLILPLLCVVALAARIALRNQPPRTQHAWTTYLSTLLIVSGFFSTVGVVTLLSVAPAPSIGNAGLSELDERTQFPTLPASTALDGIAVSQQLKPLVVVISPSAKLWFGRGDVRSSSIGSGALLAADSSGYLFVTAHHVVGGAGVSGRTRNVMLTSLSGVWGTAEVVGIHRQFDLALIWMPRRSGDAKFIQPVSKPKEGEPIFVIGHPQGLHFTLSNGMVSREQNGIVQITAPISPGNSGGPIYDDHGRLLGIVTSTMDKSIDPNAENLNFAVNSESLLSTSGWEFGPRGQQYLESVIKANAAQ